MATAAAKVRCQGQVLGVSLLILVIVGNHFQPFDRLVRSMDEVAENIEEDVIIQLGYCTYIPTHAKYFRFLPEESFKRLFNGSRLIVCHGGACIFDCLISGKPFIVVPRLKKFREAPNDYQLDLAVEVKKRGFPAVYDTDELGNVLKNAGAYNMPKGLSNLSEEYKRLLEKLSSYISQMSNTLKT